MGWKGLVGGLVFAFIALLNLFALWKAEDWKFAVWHFFAVVLCLIFAVALLGG